MTSALFQPFMLGSLELPNRAVMAPMTRMRASDGTDAPHELNAVYYAQRAEAGLIISEASQVSPQGKGYYGTPGIYSPEQVAGWRLVTDAVHAAGGRIFLQLWHVGRFSHPSLQPGGALPVAPSAIIPEGLVTRGAGAAPLPVGLPRALEADELPGIAADFARGAANAIAAGFDGVEIHGSGGYLIDEFLRDSANLRTDEFGGSVENRMRFPLMVVDAVIDAVGPERMGIRLCPISFVQGVIDSDPAALYFPLMDELSRRRVGYVHVVEGATHGPRGADGFDFAGLRKRFGGAWMPCNQYTAETAHEAIASGYADLVAFGRPYLANPDLLERFKSGAPLAAYDQKRVYTGGADGYTDYPPLALA